MKYGNLVFFFISLQKETCVCNCDLWYQDSYFRIGKQKVKEKNGRAAALCAQIACVFSMKKQITINITFGCDFAYSQAQSEGE